VLYGLGIRHVGSVNAQLLTQRFPTVEHLAEQNLRRSRLFMASARKLPNLYTSGSASPQSLISRLKAAGVQLASDVDIAALSGNQPLLSGKTFVITGTLPEAR